MGLVDLTNRVKNVENNTDYIQRWIQKNQDLLASASDFNDRISALEGATTSQFTDKLKDYTKLFSGKEHEHGFIFFTDSHDLCENYTDYEILMHMHFYKAIFENTPARYVLNGGDWINTKHTLEEAKYYIGRVPNLMREEITERSYGVIGNHDLNVEGNSGHTELHLTEEQLAYIWFGKDVAYYTVDYENTRCFMFDSGNQVKDMTPYRWKQLDWFANELLNNTKPHLFGVIHIIYINMGLEYEQLIPQLGYNLTLVANAFNNRTTITLNDETYDFTNANGIFHFMIAGHYHNTQDYVYNGIPVIWSPAGLQADCYYADFDNATLNIVRISASSASDADRIINIVPAS